MTVTRFSNGAIKDDLLATNTSFAASDMELISTIRVGSAGATGITFTNIPQEYKHLQIRAISRGGRAYQADYNSFRFNGDTTGSYSYHRLWGNGTAAASEGSASLTTAYFNNAAGTAAPSGTFGAAIIDILDYSNSGKYKTVRNFNGVDVNGTGGVIELYSTVWMKTSPVTSVEFITTSTPYPMVQYTRYSMYGIRG